MVYNVNKTKKKLNIKRLLVQSNGKREGFGGRIKVLILYIRKGLGVWGEIQMAVIDMVKFLGFLDKKIKIFHDL